MAKDSNIVHQYFKKDFEDFKVLVKVNPIQFKGSEITVHTKGNIELRELEFDSDIFDDLTADGFEPSSPLEFNLYFSGLAGS
jgi:hypothetical protein